MSNNKCKIYALVSSEDTSQIRYIGKTIKSFKQRLACHLCTALKYKLKNYRCNWIRKVYADGFKVEIILIGEVLGDGRKEEIAFIQYAKEEGWKLTNNTNGGEGQLGRIVSSKTRKKKSIKMKKYFKFFKNREKARVAAFNRTPMSAADREKTRNAHRSPEARRKISLTQLNVWKSPKYKKRMGIIRNNRPPDSIETLERKRIAQNRPEIKLKKSIAIKAAWQRKKSNLISY